MKTKPIIAASVAMVVLAGVLVISQGPIASASSSLNSPPTVAPARTPGPVSTEMPFVTPILVGSPLVTIDQALRQALKIDQNTALWENPWTLDTPKTDPARITIKAFPSETIADGDAGQIGQEQAQREKAIGPVWRVSIAGHVHVSMLDMNINLWAAVYDGVTYTFAQDSGDLVSVDTGPLIPGAAPITPPPPPTQIDMPTPGPLPTRASYPFAPTPTALPTRAGYPPPAPTPTARPTVAYP